MGNDGPYTLEKHVKSTQKFAGWLGVGSGVAVLAGVVIAIVGLSRAETAGGVVKTAETAANWGIIVGLVLVIAGAILSLASVQLIRSLKPHLERLPVRSVGSEFFVLEPEKVKNLAEDIANAPDGFPAEWLRCLTNKAKARLAANDLVGVRTILTATHAVSRHVGERIQESDLHDTFELLHPGKGVQYCWDAAREAVAGD